MEEQELKRLINGSWEKTVNKQKQWVLSVASQSFKDILRKAIREKLKKHFK